MIFYLFNFYNIFITSIFIQILSLLVNTLSSKTPEITHIVDLGFKIGNDTELHHVKLGLFGKETP